MSTLELWREMLSASDAAIKGEPPGARADALIAQAHMEVLQRYLCPDGPPTRPCETAEFHTWMRFGKALADVQLFLAECDEHPQEDAPVAMLQEPDGEADAPPATSHEDFQ